jgi:hypothetical protein
MDDHSIEDDLRVFLQQGFEQMPVFQGAAATGQAQLNLQQALDAVSTLIAHQGEAIFRLAREVDNLRAELRES